MRNRSLSLFVVAVVLVSCSSVATPSATDAPSDASQGVTTNPEVDVEAFAISACDGTTYSRCIESMRQAVAFFDAGSQVAICEYENGEGDVVLMEPGDDAEDLCSGGGLFPDYLDVFDTVQLPK